MLGIVMTTPIEGSASEDPGYRPQTQPSRLVFAAGALVQLGRDELRWYDPTSLAVHERRPFPGGQGIGVLADGAVVTAGARELVRWQGQTATRFASATTFRGRRAGLLAAARPTELFVAPGRGNQVVRMELAAGQAWPRATVRVAADDQARVVSGEPLLYATAGFVVRGDERLPAPEPAVRHLVRGVAGELWASAGTRLVRWALGKTVTVRATHELGGAIVALAAAERVAVALTFAADTWRLVLVDGTGERWRRDVPRPEEWDDPSLAVSASRVVLGGADALAGWDVATGKRL
jgi:hypothetical protein